MKESITCVIQVNPRLLFKDMILSIVPLVKKITKPRKYDDNYVQLKLRVIL